MMVVSWRKRVVVAVLSCMMRVSRVWCVCRRVSRAMWVVAWLVVVAVVVRVVWWAHEVVRRRSVNSVMMVVWVIVVWVIVVWVVWLLLGCWVGWVGWVCMVAVGVCRWCGCI